MSKPEKEKGERIICQIEPDGTLVHICLMCEQKLDDTNKPHYASVWIWEELERNYIYELCGKCFDKYVKEENLTEQIEDKLMLISATRPKLKATTKSED